MNDALFRPSSMLRRKLCPGSLALESTLPVKVGDEPDDEWQAEGRLLHALIADPSLPRDGLKPSQLDLILIVERSEAEFIQTLLRKDKPEHVHISEKTFVFIRGAEVLFSGTPDAVWVFKEPSAVIVSDRKTGFKAVQQADANLQLRSYLVMAADVFPSENYYGLITQPRISSRPLTVQYAASDIVKARAEIEAVYDACYAPDAPRRPSEDGCSFCEAKALCPEFRSWVGAVERARHLPVAAWSDEELDIFESRRGILEKWLKETHEQIKALKQADPERLPGWCLKSGSRVRTVSDLVSAWGMLQPLLADYLGEKAARKFSDCCSISIGDLEDLIYDMRKNTPQKLSQRETKALVNQTLANVLEYKENKPSLVREKE